MVDYLHKELEVFLACVLAGVAPAAKVKGLIAAYVKFIRAEQGDKLVYKACNQLYALLVGYIDSVVSNFLKQEYLAGLPVFHLAKMLVLIALQKVIQVSESSQ